MKTKTDLDLSSKNLYFIFSSYSRQVTLKRTVAKQPPTDLLHRSRLINTALFPIYNHVLMALPIPEDVLQNLDKEVLFSFDKTKWR